MQLYRISIRLPNYALGVRATYCSSRDQRKKFCNFLLRRAPAEMIILILSLWVSRRRHGCAQLIGRHIYGE